MDKHMSVNGTEYTVIMLLGKGKGGYSYLVSRENEDTSSNYYVIKQIHHEPCSYYTFGNKLESEVNDYGKLSEIGITMPKLIDIDWENERILKEYIDGDTIFELVCKDMMKPVYFDMIREMTRALYAANANIDYFPTNFVVNNERLYYIDYECNEYTDEWNFENWGILYWSRTREFQNYLDEKNGRNSRNTVDEDKIDYDK